MTGRAGHSGGARAGAGRHPAKATIRGGMIVALSQVYPDGHADLGRGVVSEVKRLIGADRVVIIPQDDGSEIRIVIGSE